MYASERTGQNKAVRQNDHPETGRVTPKINRVNLIDLSVLSKLDRVSEEF